ncbi:hypothetical protein E2562_013647 [Oryza meyeriana var. granulata]|uniref:Uncharacterized protein n=1 Tax=Oryza meyeriana var. granulata TaxID=110450 RepID=A0A6G1BK68_9ORYZ|nr:hypothetical protein E2562_013647 [Oryza meyeriana var. granulata]
MGIGDDQAQMRFPRPLLCTSASSPSMKIERRGRGLQIATGTTCRRRCLRVGWTWGTNLFTAVHHGANRLAHGEVAKDPSPGNQPQSELEGHRPALSACGDSAQRGVPLSPRPKDVDR